MEYICTICQHNFACKRNLDNHVAIKACKSNMFFCKLCLKGFTTNTSMYRHMRSSCKIKIQSDTIKNEIYEQLIITKKESDDQIKQLRKENKKLKQTLLFRTLFFKKKEHPK